MSEKTIPQPSPEWLSLDINQKCIQARNSRPGDIWVNKNTGREIAIKTTTWGEVVLEHGNGKITTKQNHYFAYDYFPKLGENSKPIKKSQPPKLERLLKALVVLEHFASQQKPASIGGIDWLGMAQESNAARIDFEGYDRTAEDQ